LANNRFIGRLNAFNQYMAYKYGEDHFWFNFDKRDYCMSQELGMEYVQKLTDQERKKKCQQPKRK